MPDTAHERLVVGGARLLFKENDFAEWTAIDQPMGKKEFHNNVSNLVLDGGSVSCEQRNNKDLTDRKGNRPNDLAIWRASFKRASIKNMRIKENVSPGGTHDKVGIWMEFTYDGSPHCEDKTKQAGTRRLETGKSGHDSAEENPPTASETVDPPASQSAEGGGKAEIIGRKKRLKQLFEKASDLPLAKVRDRSGPAQFRFEWKRNYAGQGDKKKKTTRAWHWGAAFALLAGCSTYTWSGGKKAYDLWTTKSLADWVKDQGSEWKNFAEIKKGEDDWFDIVPKGYDASIVALASRPAKRRVENVAEAQEQPSKRTGRPSPQPKHPQSKKELVEELIAINEEMAALAKKMDRLAMRESSILAQLKDEEVVV